MKQIMKKKWYCWLKQYSFLYKENFTASINNITFFIISSFASFLIYGKNSGNFLAISCHIQSGSNKKLPYSYRNMSRAILNCLKIALFTRKLVNIAIFRQFKKPLTFFSMNKMTIFFRNVNVFECPLVANVA